MFSWLRFLIVSCVLALASCGGGGGSPGANPNTGGLSLGGLTAVTVLPGESRSITVSGGVPPYRASSAETSVAVAAIDGNTLVVGGMAAGASTKVTVTDRGGNTVALDVSVGSSVPLYTTAPAALTLGVGPSQARTFLVAGGVKPYTITGSQDLVARVTDQGGGQWRIEGVAIGDMVVRIRDAAGTELLINVTVGSPELRISSDALTLPIGIPATVVLSGGQKPYSIAGGIPAAIQVRLLPGTDDTFEILGLLATGDVDVVFADASGKTVKTKVTVNTATTQIRVSPSAIALGEQSGVTVRFNVMTSAQNFDVFSSNPTLVSVSGKILPQFNTDGSVKAYGSFVGAVGSGCVAEDTEVTVTVVDQNGSVGTAKVTVVNVGNQSGTNPCP